MVVSDMARGETRRYWVIDIRDAASGDHVQLPPSVDWHETIRAMNMLATMYGIHNVYLYQWDIMNVELPGDLPL